MILYFDNYITNTPLIKDFYPDLRRVRTSCENYSTKDKIDITLYTLNSYSIIPWKNVLIRWELENSSKRKEVEERIKRIFPKGKVKYGRSDRMRHYRRNLKILEKMDDEFIFYAGNNDHPFIAPNLNILNICLKKAKAYTKKYEYVSILYSHFTEGLNTVRKGSPVFNLQNQKGKPEILEENEDLIVALFPKGKFEAIQIVNKNLLSKWISIKGFEEEDIWRLEDLENKIEIENQIVIIPKKRMCEHFDGYSFTKYKGWNLPSSIVPPLFIPRGFFEKNIKNKWLKNLIIKSPVKIRIAMKEILGPKLTEKIRMFILKNTYNKKNCGFDLRKVTDKKLLEKINIEIKKTKKLLRKNPLLWEV